MSENSSVDNSSLDLIELLPGKVDDSDVLGLEAISLYSS